MKRKISIRFPVHKPTPTLRSALQDNMQRYVEMVVQEIAASRQLNRQPLQSVFFGGGEGWAVCARGSSRAAD